MERLKRSFRNSFRRKKSSAHQTESSKPHQWEGDEIAVRNGNCSFPVKYLGCVQVQESRGMPICEQALLTLKAQKGKSIRGQLYVSGDGLRVVDDETKGLIVDQTIEKVSFCAPDRNHDRGFSYICRDGTTRRWMCHGFMATKDTGDRLSHAVGCSFAVCLERKQKRDAKLADLKSGTIAISTNNTNHSLNSAGSSLINSSLNSTTTTDLDNSKQQFNRTGSFRRLPLKQRMKDPQEAKLIDPLPVKEVHNPYAIERPHATPQLLERQGSCRIFRGLNQNSPFKRQLSLRFSTPSQMERQRRNSLQQSQDKEMFNNFDTSIKNASIANDQSNLESTIVSQNNTDLSAMCKYMTDNLTIMSSKQDPFDDSFQFNQSKSPIITKANIKSTSRTSTPDSSLTNSSTQHKTIINLEPLINNHLNSSKSSSPVSNPINQQKKFGQLASYSDDFLTPTPSMNNSTVSNNVSNGIMFTDLDEPFEVNFDDNVTKINLDQCEQSSLKIESLNSLNNGSMNSLSNSLTNSLNGELGNRSNVVNQAKTMNNLNQQTNLVKEINNVNNSLNNSLTGNLIIDNLMNNSTNNSLNNSMINTMNNSISSPMNNQLNNSLMNPIRNVNRKNNLNNLTNNNNIMNKKLNEKELFDPFNSEWVSIARTDDLGKNTNPFLQNMATTVKAFELKM